MQMMDRKLLLVVGYHNFIIASLTSSGSEIWVYTYGGIMGGQDNKIIAGRVVVLDKARPGSLSLRLMVR